jgi:hypothetical protein
MVVLVTTTALPTTVGSSVEKARKEERAEGRTDIE